MLKKIGLVVVVLVGGLMVYAAMKPAEMVISREIVVQASPEVLFPYINHSKKMNEWMPWSEIDPKTQMSYAGPDEGVGSISSWESTGPMGTGSATIIESTPNQSVKTQLKYTKPMEMSQVTEITLTPSQGGTLVRWSVVSTNAFFGRLMCVLMNVENSVGSDFEKGLQNLKRMMEKK